MADVALYFDDSGFGGTAGSEDGWAAVADWQAGLGDGDYPALSHLIENGWEDDLPGLEADISSALKDDSSDLGAGKASLEEFLSVLQDRADGDKAVAITLNEEADVEPTVDELLPADNARGGKGMPSAGADVDPAKACAIVRDGGVHDASGKWRPLTQAQRGMFGALCGQAKKGKKPTTHEDTDDDADLIRNAVAEIVVDEESVENAKGGGKGKGGASRWVTIEGEHILIKDKSGMGGGGEKGPAASAGTTTYKPVVSDLHRASEIDIAKHFSMIKAQAHTHPHEARKNAEDFLDKVESQKGKSYLHGLVLDHGIPLGVNPGGKGLDNAPPLVLRKRLLDKLFPNSPTTHEEVGTGESVEVVDGTPLDEFLTVEDIVAMYDASPQAPNQTNEEHVLALASVAERINGAARHPETGQFTSPEATNDSKPSRPSPHLEEHSSTAYEATKRVKPGKGSASDSISYSTAAYGYAVAGDHVSSARAHRKAATAHSKAYSNLREDNTERALHKAAENLHRAAARAHALLSGGPAANGEFTDTWADESDPLYGLTPEEVRDSLAELCGRQVTESVRESAILF